MDFSFNDEQQMLLDTTQRFLASEYSFERRQMLLESDEGWSREIWMQLGELGLIAVDIPEADGGIGAGPVGVMLVSQAVGQGLLLEPFLSSAIVATQAIVQCGSDTQRARWLPGMATGECISVLAHDEAGAGLDVSRIQTRATGSDTGWTLSGTKSVVYHAPMANWYLISARLDDGSLGLFAVAAKTAGISVREMRTVDGQRAADIALDNVVLESDARLGGDVSDALALVIDRGTAALCAEAFGVLDRILKATIEYSRSRKQFGMPIGSFQALQHRMADMLIQFEQARSMMYLATESCAGADAAMRRKSISGAKALIGQAARFVGQQAVQLHGGMGMTDELDISHCFKRLLAFELRFGTTDEHLSNYRLGLQGE
ncbi:acyl-CoA dehydrogenase family protein [Dokdonella sp.]|uniref:acyl-CoA dehydrogenase family protein n=1 Tax=Dokdonella sp. TaxID=2291710 RepID=UPI003C3DAE47